MECLIPCTPTYHGLVEMKIQARTRRQYFRYVVVSEDGEPLVDGYAGDVKEANDSIKAHIRYMREQSGMNQS